MRIEPQPLSRHHLQKNKDALKTQQLWELAANSKRLIDKQKAIAELYNIGYSSIELVEGLGVLKSTVFRALSKVEVAIRKASSRYHLTSKEWEDKKAEYRRRCAYCGKKTKHLEVDHVIAVSQGGEDIKANIVPACRSCNSSKNKRPLSEWRKFNGLQLNQDMI